MMAAGPSPCSAHEPGVKHMDPALVSNEGEGSAEGRPATRSERRLEERALCRRWPISPEQRQAFGAPPLRIIERERDPGPPVPTRYVVQAARALLTADRVNLEHDKRQRRAGGPDATVRRGGVRYERRR